MKYFFILGANPALSAAEILALLDGGVFAVAEVHGHVLTVEAPEGHELDAPALMARLGGTVKIGKIIDDNLPLDPETVTDRLTDRLLARPGDGRLTFGLSVYAMDEKTRESDVTGRLKNVGMEVKGRIVGEGRSARWVKNQDGPTLSSVVVSKNKMIEEGAEFCLLARGGVARLGVTVVVQPFEEFSRVDFGRPDRDTLQGMLPPKLARMMVNFAGVASPKDARLLDPFCGSGTVLTEALRLGFGAVVGSDKNPDAVGATVKNLDWIIGHGGVDPQAGRETLVADARKIGSQLAPKSVDAVVTEPFLGPPLRGGERRGDLQRTLGELQMLYRDSLASWRTCLKPDAPIIVAFPSYVIEEERHGVRVKEFEALGYRVEPLLPASVLARLGVPETKNRGLLYGRGDQRVWRDIVRLRYQG